MNDVLANLSRAGIATHVVRPASSGDIVEVDLVAALLSATGGELYRVAPCTYAFDAGAVPRSAPVAEDSSADGASDRTGDPAADRAEAVRVALAELLGEDAVSVEPLGPATGVSGPGGPVGDQEPLEGRAVTLLRALTDGARVAIVNEAPDLRAVIDASFAVSAARLTAEGLHVHGSGRPSDGDIEHRLERIEQILHRLAESPHPAPEQRDTA